ncbi:MAG: alpha-L-fucosidase, partial [Saprospiraceae bacterium]|nr:alpha-L-fucosidase [Saprospiraceae bacterium]
VSRGGNLLLDIGPRADGKIPPVMQERLLQMGKWLSRNGEAIYRTRPWSRPVQWSEGNKDCKPVDQHYLGGDFILKQTIDPEPGCAVKELFFTRKESIVYAISPLWPGETLTIEDLSLKSNAKITLLGSSGALEWKTKDGNIEITLPKFDQDGFQEEFSYGYVFRIDE